MNGTGVKTTVGISDRTPGKHRCLYCILGREVASAQHNPMFDNLAWYDVTAGDGIPATNPAWTHGCSPGILAHHARFLPNGKPVTVHLYERALTTYETLIDNLTGYLPTLGYRRIDDSTWQQGNVWYQAHLAPGGEAEAAHVGSRTAALLINDPNNVHQWACPRELLERLNERTRYLLMVSTMGCNAGGILMLSRATRDRWFANLDAQLDVRAEWHDCYLAAIRNDAARWGYLFTAPAFWAPRVESDVRKSFAAYGFELDCAWQRAQPERFAEIRDRLFLTLREQRCAT